MQTHWDDINWMPRRRKHDGGGGLSLQPWSLKRDLPVSKLFQGKFNDNPMC